MGPRVQLERELRETRERLQSMIEEYETALEELKSSNEELVSVNEELQSTNEELEASKEELQSVNEELHTVNLNSRARVDELDRANTDLQNLFDSTEVATVFLDRNLRDPQLYPGGYEVFNILPSDRGRPITDLSSHFVLRGLRRGHRQVFAGAKPIERRIEEDEAGANYLVRFAPYRDGEQARRRSGGHFVDVTALSRRRPSAHADRRAAAPHPQPTGSGAVDRQQTLGRGASLKSFNDRLASMGRVQSLVSGAMKPFINRL